MMTAAIIISRYRNGYYTPYTFVHILCRIKHTDSSHCTMVMEVLRRPIIPLVLDSCTNRWDDRSLIIKKICHLIYVQLCNKTI